MREFRERTGHAILERYGMTETNMNTSNPYDGDRIAGTVGFPLPGVELRIADPETGKALRRGEIGVHRGARAECVRRLLAHARQDQGRIPRPTASSSPAMSARSTSAAMSTSSGAPRISIITGGFNVYPKEIESEIDALPGVVESAVIGCPHPDFGEGVTAVVVPARRRAASNEKAIIAELESRLAKFKLPKRVLFVDDLPRNTMGKVQKNVLREQNKTLYG